MLRKPVFWVAFVLVAVVASVVTYFYFPTAFPLVTLDLRMDRQLAMAEASKLAPKYAREPETARRAAAFRLDSQVQNFVELEAGGVGAYREMLAGELYSPYTWQVRLFHEGETEETRFRFTPRGEPYGFVRTLPEDQPGEREVSAEEARALAEKEASDDWAVDVTSFELVEQSEEKQTGGRIDHSFVYRREGQSLGEGEYRLRLVVGGGRLTELTHFVKVPEAFSRRYEEMRSANNVIAAVASIAAIVLYLLGGCVAGLALLLRERWVIWRQPVLWGFGVSLVQALAGLNQWPLAWMSYDTALSSSSFVLSQLGAILLQFLGFGIVLSVSFMAAESLSRRAFPHHVRLWHLWRPPVAGSPTVLGYTVAGLLLVGIFFAYEVGLYFFTSHTLGWWSPSSALFDPDVLATYFPWLTSIAISLQAGFWEECLFRAVPIAGAALLGQRFGGRRAWIVGALILQALVFGAGHANYPAQPAYARVVELIIPALAFGLIYLAFGLLPAIVLHYVFDVVWIALPLFVSQAPGVWVDQLLVVLLALVPVWMVLRGRLRTGAWQEVKEEDLNRSFVPPAPVVREETAEPEPARAMPALVRRLLPAAGLLGLVLWLVVADFSSDAPPLEIGRREAAERAEGLLAERGIKLEEPWMALPSVQAGVDDAMRFVWQEGGEEAYRQLLGSYLTPPRWLVRFARFEGDVAELAEEYHVHLEADGRLARLTHELPEARAGASLSQAEAERLAQQAVRDTWELDPSALEQVSVEPSQQPERGDWEITWADREGFPLETGEARLAVGLAGDEVVDTVRYVHVQEEWERRQRDRNTLLGVARIASWVVTVGLLLAGVVAGVVHWSRNHFSVRVFLGFFALLGLLALANLANSWPALKAQFSTAQPYEFQALLIAGFGCLGALIAAAGVALVIGFVESWRRPHGGPDRWRLVGLGLALGLAGAGLVRLLGSVTPALAPSWAAYEAAGTWVPWFDELISPVSGTVQRAALFLLVFAALDRFTRGWQRRRLLFALLLIPVGFALAGLGGAESLGGWAVGGLALAGLLLAAYVLVLRYDLALVPLAVAGLVVPEVVREGLLRAHPTALPAALGAALLVLALAVHWSSRLARTE